MTEPKDTKPTTSESKSPKTEEPADTRATVWMDVGHLAGDLPEGVVPQGGKVLVYSDTGEVVPDQPDLQKLQDEADAQAEKAAKDAAKGEATK